MYDVINDLGLEIAQDTIIKVMGIGGGGCNAVNYMYSQGIKDVSFLVCNTDKQALASSSIPAKLQLGPGLGAGGKPEVAQEYAEQSRARIHDALNDGTKMLFLTAGMGGGTGTGASSVVAEVAKEMDILTVGIVTIPFSFEGPKKIKKAMIGVAQLAENVDAILVINNEKLRQIYPDFNFMNAFSKSDDVVANAARSIAEIVTVTGYINTDFADVYNTLKDGNVAIMSVGCAEGEQRINQAIQEALHSPLVNKDVKGASRILLQFYCSKDNPIMMSELDYVHDFVREVGDDADVIWGVSIDETLGDKVRVTVIATGYDVSDIPGLNAAVGRKTVEEAIGEYYGETDKEKEKTIEPEPQAEPEEEQTQEPEEPVIEEESDIPEGNEIIISLDGDIDLSVSQPKIERTVTTPSNPSSTSTSRGLTNLKDWMRGRR